MTQVTLKVRQESLQKTFTKLLLEYKLTEMEISLLCGVQGLLIERLIKDGKLGEIERLIKDGKLGK